MRAVLTFGVFMAMVSFIVSQRVIAPGCVHNKPYPLVFDGTKQREGDIFTPGYNEGKYPDKAYCDYSITAPPGYIVKLTFKVMDLESALRCSKDKVFVIDGPDQGGDDLGAYCGMEPPPYPILSTKNGMHLSFRTDTQIGRRGFHAHYEIIRPEDACPRGYSKCTNNNCYHPNQKCDGEDNCGDGTDEENCNRPLATSSCGNGNILPLDALGRIVGGIEARSGSWPWQVDLHIPKFFPDSHNCGGSLINAEWVMTALHCIVGLPRPEQWRVIVGNHHRYLKDPDQQFRYVTRLIIYPNFTGEEVVGKQKEFTHDIGLMKLNAPVKFSDRVKPACLPPEGYELPMNTQCFTTGWGETKGSGYQEVLKQAEVYTKPVKDCSGRASDSETQICAKNDQSLQDSCSGDSGGPLNCKMGDKYYVMGITSYAFGDNWMSGTCAIEKMGAFYQKVSGKISWINQMIAKYS